jgi:uridine kinase
LALAIVAAMNLPWVVILSMVSEFERHPCSREPITKDQQDSFYKVLTPEQSAAAFRNEFDFDSPDAIDFDVLVDVLRDLKHGY